MKKKGVDLFIQTILCACRYASAMSERWTILSRLKLQARKAKYRSGMVGHFAVRCPLCRYITVNRC